MSTSNATDPVFGFKLRPYQQKACRAIATGFLKREKKSLLLVLPTGCGKTICFGSIAKWAVNDLDRKVLVLAHRGELLDQAADKLSGLGLHTAIEKADSYARALMFDDPTCVIASVQTMQRKRLETWPKDYFGLIITDECFPAGTLVDGRAIEKIRRGDEVASFNETTWLVEKRPVVRTFAKRPSGLVRVHLSDGSSFVCTPEHPIFTYAGCNAPAYVDAKDLTSYNMVYAITSLQGKIRDGNQTKDVRHLRDNLHSQKLEQHDDSDLLARVQAEEAGVQAEVSDSALRRLWDRGCLRGATRARNGQEQAALLLNSVPRQVRRSDVVDQDGGNQPSLCVRADDTEESNARPCGESQDASKPQGDGVEAIDSRREWAGTNETTSNVSIGIGLGHRVCRQDGNIGTGGNGIPLALQDRHCQPVANDRNRDRRWLTLRSGETISGPKEGGLSPVARVVRVEVLERGSDGTFGGLCPDGFVYNIEVEGNHNYFVDGLLVHNCHHAPAKTYQRIYNHFDSAWHLGVTATADRLDGENLGQVFSEVVYEYALRDAIEEGFLSRITIARCETSVDLASIKTTGGDLNQGDLEDAIRPHIEELANATRQEIGCRPTIVFTPDVGSAEAFASALNGMGIRAESISGDDRHRASKIDRFMKKDFQVLVNCAILTEGFDAPHVEAVVLARPTKSRALYAQMVGRGARLSPGKDNCLVVDFAWLTGKHKLVNSVELFDTTGMLPETKEAAKKMVEDGEEVDILEAIAKAERQAEDLAIKRALDVQVKERAARYRKVSYDPFAVLDAIGISSGRKESSLAAVATEKQIEVLTKMGIEDAAGISKRRASMMIDNLFARRNNKMASFKQVRCLIKQGVNPKEAGSMSFTDASAFLEAKFGNARAS